jgi:uroporphyrinogen-III decarboxylase
MEDFASMLDKNQVFSGKSDPVSVIQDSAADIIKQSVNEDFIRAKKRCIVSAGCEITPGTSIENMKAFSMAAKDLNLD